MRNLSTQWTRLISASSILEVRFGYNAPWNPNCTLNSAIDRPTFLDRTGIQMFQRDVLCSPIPNMSSEGEFGAGGGGTNTGDKVWQFISNYATQAGSHSIKFGINYSRRHFYTNTSNPMNGNLWFNGELTSLFSEPESGFSTATMLLGTPRQFRRSTGETITNGRINAWQLYAQDDWRVTSKLTVNLGFRYEYNNPAVRHFGRAGQPLGDAEPRHGKPWPLDVVDCQSGNRARNRRAQPACQAAGHDSRTDVPRPEQLRSAGRNRLPN